jgi:hypothetical protein
VVAALHVIQSVERPVFGVNGNEARSILISIADGGIVVKTSAAEYRRIGGGE